MSIAITDIGAILKEINDQRDQINFFSYSSERGIIVSNQLVLFLFL